MLKNENEHHNRKTEVFWHKNRKTDQKNSQNRKSQCPPHTKLHNPEESQEWASRLLTTADTYGPRARAYRTTGLVQRAINIYIIIINDKNLNVTS